MRNETNIDLARYGFLFNVVCVCVCVCVCKCVCLCMCGVCVTLCMCDCTICTLKTFYMKKFS